MIEIKKIYKKDIPDLLLNTDFWNHSFLSISKHRLYAHYKNPTSSDDHIVLLLSYLDNELVGYMGVYIDNINIDGTTQKIGWLSTWWVHPKTKGSGIGREILNTMYAENNGKIGISQFTPSAKRVYDKSGYFTALKENIGLKAVLRSNLSFVIPSLYKSTANFYRPLNLVDGFFNFFVNAKLQINNASIKKDVKKLSVEYINIIDTEALNLIERFGSADISTKTPDFFEWLKAYNWVQPAPLLSLTNKSRYEFSMYDIDFQYSFIKVIKDNLCIGFVVLQKRRYVLKVLYTYFDQEKYSPEIANIIKLEAINTNTREIICYDKAICNEFKKSSVFLYKTKKVKQSIISKAFRKTDFDDVRVNFGDGDCSFA